MEEPSWAIAETHISTVVFSGEVAYKWYKPVKTAFLDHSTVDRRRDGARREVALNRRLAPDVYLGTAQLVSDEGEVLDHLVRMRRLPADRRLAALAHTAEAEAQVDAIARRLAIFHAGARRSPEIDAEATAAVLTHRWEQNLRELGDLVGGWVTDDERDTLRALALRYLDGRIGLFDDRRIAGWACDGHGDLLADDIFCLADGPRILDCLNFDDRLRWGDVLADLSFLMMDLERLGRADLSNRLLRSYREFTDERHPASLADHYVALRALIRAKVAYLRAEQTDDGEVAERSVAEGRARLAQAHAHLQAGDVRMVLVGGAPGSGKSTVADRVGAALSWVVLGSDELRKVLLGLPVGADLSSAPGAGAYAPEAVAGVYREMLVEAGRLLRGGESVVLDASWLQADRRDEAQALALEVHATFIEIECQVADDERERRIVERRAVGGSASDATIEVSRQLVAGRDPWPSAVPIDTSGSAGAAVARALASVAPESAMATADG